MNRIIVTAVVAFPLVCVGCSSSSESDPTSNSPQAIDPCANTDPNCGASNGNAEAGGADDGGNNTAADECNANEDPNCQASSTTGGCSDPNEPGCGGSTDPGGCDPNANVACPSEDPCAGIPVCASCCPEGYFNPVDDNGCVTTCQCVWAGDSLRDDILCTPN